MSRPYRILAFGDSITAFRGDLKVASLIVQEYLNENGFYAQVMNCGIPGNNTLDARGRFERDVLELYPDIVWMMFGTNDSAIDVSQGKTEPRVSLNAYEDNVRFMLKEMKKQGIHPLVLSSPALVMTENLKPLYDMPPYSNEGFNFMVAQYVQKAQELAESECCPFINIFEKFMNLTGGDEQRLEELLPDGMHPGQEGQNLIAEEIIRWIDDTKPLSLPSHPGVDTIQCLDWDVDTDSFRMKCSCTKELDLLKIRFRNHDNAKMSEYSEWTEIPFAADGEGFRFQHFLPETGTYTIQLKCLKSGNTSGIGKADFIRIG